MKNTIKAILAAAVIGSVVALTSASHSAGWVYTPMTVPTALSQVTNATLTNYSGPNIPIPQNVPITITAQVFGNVSNVQPCVIGFDGSPDGTNWTTTTPWRFTNSQPGFTNGGFAMQFTAAQLAGIQYLKYSFLSQVSATATTNYGMTAAWFY